MKERSNWNMKDTKKKKEEGEKRKDLIHMVGIELILYHFIF
mgnify:CR=1 FL=1